MTGAWQRWSGALAVSTERDFERLCLPFLRVFWPNLDLVPARKDWDRRGIDLLVWVDEGRYPCAVQCKGFVVQELAGDQLAQVRNSIASFKESGVQVETYLVVHNRDGRDGDFRAQVEQMLAPIVESGQAIRAELWDRQKLLTNCRSELEVVIGRALRQSAEELLRYYAELFAFGAAYLRDVPVTESRLGFRRFEPCTLSQVSSETSLPASELILSTSEARWSLLTGSFGAGKTTTVLHAAASGTCVPVLIECRALPSTKHELNSTSVLLEEGCKSLRLFEAARDHDRPLLYEVAGTTFKNMLMGPQSNFVLILDGLDENRFYSQMAGMEFLSNQLADLQCPIVLTTRREHLNTMFGDFSIAFQEFSNKFGARREARLLNLDPWLPSQSLALCDLVIQQTQDEPRARLFEFRQLLASNAASDLYGDLPSNPLMLRFILEDVAEIGIHHTSRTALIDSWMRRKIRRDRSVPSRLAISEMLDVEELVDRILLLMEEVAIAQTALQGDTVELVETIPISTVREVATRLFGSSAENILSVVLNSFLFPIGHTAGQERSFSFAFRVIQEYLVARYLKRMASSPDGYPDSVLVLYEDIR